jgi:hypothetical protein
MSGRLIGIPDLLFDGCENITGFGSGLFCSGDRESTVPAELVIEIASPMVIDEKTRR